MTEAAIVNEPVVDAGNQPVTPKEFRYEYQPTENGQPLGGKQGIVYDGTPEDLGRKMADQNTELIKLNRRLNKDLRLGNIIQDEIPQGAARFDESKYQLVPEPLTADERIKLAGDIVDPERFDAAAQRIVRASIGDPDAL